MPEHAANLPVGCSVPLPGHFDTPVVLEEVRRIGDGYECRVRLPDGTLDEVVISKEEAAALTARGTSPQSIRLVDAADLRLLVESARIRLAFSHDRQFAVSLSGIRTLPHQVEAVYQKMLPQPALRFLLADDPGAGKTIMAGLLIKELKLREAVDRVLILCPAPLTIQWQDEMLRWFGEPFDIIFSAVDQQQLANPWQRANQIIASLDYAKQDDVRERVWQQRWDLVIIDEAHKCSARTGSSGPGRGPSVVMTKRYELAAKLTGACDHVLLMTATPHHGDDEKFSYFLRLIDPDIFPEPHRLERRSVAELRGDVFRLGGDCPWMLRRLKEDLKDMNGQRLFPDRHAVTVPFALNPEEFALYKAVTSYINEFIPQQQGQRKTSAALARTVLQRRLASSACAIHESLKRRQQKQQTLLDELEALPPAQRSRRLAQLQGRLVDSEQDEDDLNDEERDVLLDEFTAAVELDQLRAEIAALKDLVEQARRVRAAGNDSKLKALKECLARATFDELKDGRGKLLIFTEHRDTLNYIKEHLARWNYTTCEIHGGMNPHERKRAQENFRTQAQVCLATEAAGEGINLQFCHLMINYDMPWNPTRLEQRLLPYPDPSRCTFVLQDVDAATPSTESTSILTDKMLIGKMKTRSMASWCERRGFNALIYERRLDNLFKRQQAEPAIALCGIDNALGRVALDEVGFDLIVEAGLGRGHRDFRTMRLHTLPGPRKASDIWRQKSVDAADVTANEAYQRLLREGTLDQCGVTLLAGKAVGAPFVGTAAAAIAIAEVLRLLHGGRLYQLIDADLVAVEHRAVVPNPFDFSKLNPGFIELK
jgi:superfamily II DNA or RNA helicase